ncbi:MAG: hypothetical protein OXT06_17215, partial [Rhodospirillaceae bacterium]|nr:hypothetical protein [Rhodospirillaceae bacterium]
RCEVCGYESNADENAARIIAMKGRWLTKLPKKPLQKGEKLADELRFDAYLAKVIDKRKRP